MTIADGTVIQPTNKPFRVDFCTVAHWKNGEIVEENLFYDLMGMLTQIGVLPAQGKDKAA
jgi:ketosteroid isomerase-like protein